MQYMGSKNRISKFIVPILQEEINRYDIKYYIEPFVGGANIIDKIDCENKIEYDINYYLIELLKYLSNNDSSVLYDTIPEVITFEDYKKAKQCYDKVQENMPDWYIGLVGICGSFGNVMFNGYARNSRNDTSGQRTRSAIKNLFKQEKDLKGIVFENKNYIDIKIPKQKCLIYCDPPYKNTRKYKTNDIIDYNEYYNWLLDLKNKGHIIYCSEYNMPKNFKCIWEKEVAVTFGTNVNKKETEKLFIL